MTTQAEQVPFQFEFTDNYTFKSFHSGNQPLVAEVCRQVAQGVGELQIYLHGVSGSGKTHLLTSCCHEALECGARISYIPAELIQEADSLQGMESMDLVCIDDVQNLNDEGELAVFNLINDMRAKEGRLVFSSDLPPSDLSIELADLRSRLTWGPIFQLQTLKGEFVKEALVKRAFSLGLNLPEDVADYIYKREARDFKVLDQKLEKLLNAAVISKRRFTIPFVKDVLKL